MSSELFSGDSFLVICFLQSVVFVLLGLAGSYLFRKRAARAHRLLFLSMAAAVIVPGLSMLVKYYGLGLFVEEVVVSEAVVEEAVFVREYEPVVVERAVEYEYEAEVSEEYAEPAVAAEKVEIDINWRAVFIWGWVGVSLLLVVRLVWMFCCGSYRLGKAKLLECEEIKAAAEAARRKVGIEREVGVYSIDLVCSPVIWCWGGGRCCFCRMGLRETVMALTGRVCFVMSWHTGSSGTMLLG